MKSGYVCLTKFSCNLGDNGVYGPKGDGKGEIIGLRWPIPNSKVQ